MKFYNYLFLSFVLLGGLSSCVDEDTSDGSNDYIKSFAAVPWAYTSSRMNDVTNEWGEGDKVGMFKFAKNDVSAPAELSCNIPFTTSSNGTNVEFVSEIGVPTSQLAADFVAYYPFSNDASGMLVSHDLSDQSSGYAVYDLMWAQNKNIVKKSQQDMTFTFQHQFAKLVFKPLIREGQNVNNVVLKGSANQSEFNLATGVMTIVGYGDIKLYKDDRNGEFICLLPPASSTSGLQLEITTSGVIGDEVYEYRILDSGQTSISAGKIYNLNVELGDYIYGVIEEVDGTTSPYEDMEDVDDFIGIKPVEFAAFPGALGAGKNTRGGRGGKVLHVTNLDDDANNPPLGSFRWACNQSGARTIVFDIAGTIHLKADLALRNDYVTIAGQTSPGGICIADYGFTIKANEVIIRYMRFRPGDVSGGEPDGIGGMDRKNVIVDHCSASWSVDECLAVYGMENSTVQWCMGYQALRVSTHGKGTHGFGAMWGGNKASYHHNLLAHCESRMPRLGPRNSTQLNEHVDIRNNVYYNWDGQGCYGGENQTVNIVNNYYKPGPATTEPEAYRVAKLCVQTNTDPENDFLPSLYKWGDFYITGNVVEGYDDVTADNWTRGVYEQQSNDEETNFSWNDETKDSIRFDFPVFIPEGGLFERSAKSSYAAVLKYVGASNYRDVLDELIISDVINGTASCTAIGNKDGFINTPSEVLQALPELGNNPYPELKTDTSVDVTDTDNDGMPDKFELSYGLDPNNSSDGNAKTLDPDGNYTNLEIYLHLLVEKITESQYLD